MTESIDSEPMAGARALFDIIDAAPIGVGVWDRDLRCIIFNASLAAVAGVPHQEAAAGQPADCLPGAWEQWRAHFEAALEGQATQSVEIEGRNRAHRWFAVVASFYPIRAWNRVTGVAVVCADLTPQRRAQRALERSEQRYRSLAEALPAMVSLTDAQGRPFYWNRAFFEYTGLTEEQARDPWNQDFVVREDIVAAADEWARNTQAGKPAEAEVRIRGRDGVFRWHMVRAVPLGDPPQWLLTATDIDDTKRSQQRLREANAAKDEFLSLLSHELRTPITTIVGNARVLQDHIEDLDPATRDAALADISSEGTRLGRIIENLLALARLDHGRDVEIEPVHLLRITEKVLEARRREHPVRPYRLEASGEVIIIDANEIYLEQILRNLITNAERYSAADEPIDVRIADEGAHVTIEVLDRGVGIEPGEIEALFEPFYRSSRTSAVPGIGVGLSVCKRLVEFLGGALSACPRQGGGSIFQVSLPLAPRHDD